MKLFTVVCILFVLFLSGCSSVVIIPRPATPGAVVNPSDQSIRINNSGLTVSARIQDTAVGGYDINTAIAAFYLTINNQTDSSIAISLDLFSLQKSKDETLKPIPPEEVNAILSPQMSGLMPYPFVGYYDVVDLEQHRASSAMASERPFVGSGLSAIDSLTPLPVGSLGRGQQISGMLYFNIEIIDENFVDLRAIIPAGKLEKKRSFSFPFSIEK